MTTNENEKLGSVPVNEDELSDEELIQRKFFKSDTANDEVVVIEKPDTTEPSGSLFIKRNTGRVRVEDEEAALARKRVIITVCLALFLFIISVFFVLLFSQVFVWSQIYDQIKE